MFKLSKKSPTFFGQIVNICLKPGLTRAGFNFFGSCGLNRRDTTAPTTKQVTQAMAENHM